MDKEHFYNSPAWADLREWVVHRDGGRCTVSWLLGGACSGTIHVHHIEALDDSPHLSLSPDNCASVCAHHHPRWEALRRALVRERHPEELPPCGHYHPYKSGRDACTRKRLRERGLAHAA